jgi:hypothetical protein
MAQVMTGVVARTLAARRLLSTTKPRSPMRLSGPAAAITSPSMVISTSPSVMR